MRVPFYLRSTKGRSELEIDDGGWVGRVTRKQRIRHFTLSIILPRNSLLYSSIYAFKRPYVLGLQNCQKAEGGLRQGSWNLRGSVVGVSLTYFPLRFCIL